MDKLYQVFVSSTFVDLQDERREVIEALLGIDCLPSGMELFPAADDDQWTLIKRVIDQCDYYIVISAGMYGSLHPCGKSYTQMEYEYALHAGKPIIAFLHRDLNKLSADKVERDPDRLLKLNAFRDLAKQKMIKFWDSRDSLAKAVYQSVIHLIREKPSPGWVRADRVHDDVEVLRLKNQILLLEKELEPLRRAGVGNAVLSPYTEIDWGGLFARTKTLDVLFAYAQTWRRSRTMELTQLACAKEGKIRVILPDPQDASCTTELARRFSCSEDDVKKRIYDAAGHFLSLKKVTGCLADIVVRFYPFAPQYTLYRFDGFSVLSMYSHRGSRSGVITLVLRDGILRSYILDEFEKLFRSEKARTPDNSEISEHFDELYVENA